jgi:SAM-dependent methyltransferase
VRSFTRWLSESIALNNRSEIGVVTTLTRFLFVVSVLVYAGLMVVVLVTERLPDCDRTLYAAIGSLPALAFMVALVVYQGYIARIKSSRLTTIRITRTIGIVFVLLLPSGFLVVRNMLPGLLGWGKWGLVGSLAFLLLSPLPQFRDWSAKKVWEKLATQYFRIMWNPEVLVSEVDSTTLLADRAPQYTERISLVRFQDTWAGRLEEARVSCDMLEGELTHGRSRGEEKLRIRRILDVGCGEGTFTATLLSNLRLAGILADEVDVLGIDPVNLRTEFITNLAAVQGVRATFSVGLFGTAERDSAGSAPELFDLVIASHSLYGICDSAVAGEPTASTNFGASVGLASVTQRLRELCTADGAVLVILASKRSMAYEFKRQALKKIYGLDIEDLTAECLRNVPALSLASCRVVDGVIELESLIRSWHSAASESSSREGLLAWLRYFLRAEIAIDDPLTDELVGILETILVRRCNLPEVLRESSLAATEHADEEDRILLHKTKVWLYR